MRSGCHHIDDCVECISLQRPHCVSGVSKSMKRSNSLSDMNFEGLLPAAQAQESEEERHKKSIRSTSRSRQTLFTPCPSPTYPAARSSFACHLPTRLKFPPIAACHFISTALLFNSIWTYDILVYANILLVLINTGCEA